MSADSREDSNNEDEGLGIDLGASEFDHILATAHDPSEAEALLSARSFLAKELGLSGIALGYSKGQQSEEDEDYDGDDDMENMVLAERYRSNEERELSVESLDDFAKFTADLPLPPVRKRRRKKALDETGLLSRIRKRKSVKTESIMSSPGTQPGDSQLPGSGMSKMLEEDLRAHHMTLKAMKDQLEAKLERLKADESLLLYMADLSENDLQGVQPLVKHDQVRNRQHSLDDENNDEEWRNTLYRKIRTNDPQEVGESSLQRQYVESTIADTIPNRGALHDEEDMEEDAGENEDEDEDEETALRALNHMLTEFAADEF